MLPQGHWPRVILIWSAVSAGLLYLLGAVALGSPPEAADSGTEVVDWFAEHGDGAQVYAWTSTLGALFFSIFAGIIRGVLPAPSRDIFLLGAAAFIVETAVQAWIWAGLGLHPDNLQPETSRTLLDIASYWGPLLTGATMTMIGSVTFLGFGRRPLIPRWLTVLGVIAFVEQLVETITVFGDEGFTAPGGDMNVVLGAGLTAIWLIGLVVWAVPRVGRDAATPG